MNYKFNLKKLAVIFFLFFATVIFLQKIVSSVKLLSGDDIWLEYYYSKVFLYSSLDKGELPFWNPHIYFGLPYAGDLQAQVFYPINILLYLITNPTGNINYSFVIHFFLSGIFMYMLCRDFKFNRSAALISSLVYEFNFYNITHLGVGHLSNISTTAWIPLMLLILRKMIYSKEILWIILFGVIGGLQILGGHPQYIFYSFLLYMLYSIYLIFTVCKSVKERCEKFFMIASGLILGGGIAAITLLPSMEMANHSERSAGMFYDFIVQNSMPPEALIASLSPEFFGNRQGAFYWGRESLWETCSLYIGILPLILIFFGILNLKRRKEMIFFSAAGIICILLAFGKYFPIFPFLYKHIYFFKIFRAPSKWISISLVSLSILSGYGFQNILEAIKSEKMHYFRVMIFIFTIIIFVIIHLILLPLQKSDFKSLTRFVDSDNKFSGSEENIKIENAMKHCIGEIKKLSVFSIISLILLSVLLFAGQTHKKTIIQFIIIFLLFDFYLLIWKNINSDAAPWFSKFPDDIAYKLKNEFKKNPFRYSTPNDFCGFNKGMVYGISNIDGINPGRPLLYDNYIKKTGLNYFPPSHLLSAANLTFIQFNDENAKEFSKYPYYKYMFEYDNNIYYRNMKSFPRAYFTNKIIYSKNLEETLEKLQKSNLEILQTTAFLLEEENIKLNSGITNTEEVNIIKYENNKVEISCANRTEGILILSDQYYPGWSVYVNGIEQKILQANYCFRGVYLKPGENKIVFDYKSKTFNTGKWLSLYLLILSLIIVIWRLLLLRKSFKEG